MHLDGEQARGDRTRIVEAVDHITRQGETAMMRLGLLPRSPWGIHMLEIADGRISQITNFVDPKLFALFGLPPRLDD